MSAQGVIVTVGLGCPRGLLVLVMILWGLATLVVGVVPPAPPRSLRLPSLGGGDVVCSLGLFSGPLSVLSAVLASRLLLLLPRRNRRNMIDLFFFFLQTHNDSLYFL